MISENKIFVIPMGYALLFTLKEPCLSWMKKPKQTGLNRNYQHMIFHIPTFYWMPAYILDICKFDQTK